MMLSQMTIFSLLELYGYCKMQIVVIANEYFHTQSIIQHGSGLKGVPGFLASCFLPITMGHAGIKFQGKKKLFGSFQMDKNYENTKWMIMVRTSVC